MLTGLAAPLNVHDFRLCTIGTTRIVKACWYVLLTSLDNSETPTISEKPMRCIMSLKKLELTGSLDTPRLPILRIDIRSFIGVVLPRTSSLLSSISTLPRADDSGSQISIVMFSAPNWGQCDCAVDHRTAPHERSDSCQGRKMHGRLGSPQRFEPTPAASALLSRARQMGTAARRSRWRLARCLV